MIATDMPPADAPVSRSTGETLIRLIARIGPLAMLSNGIENLKGHARLVATQRDGAGDRYCQFLGHRLILRWLNRTAANRHN